MILSRNSPNHKWRSFDKALKWTHKQNIKNKNDWKKLCNSKNFPKDIPKTPMHIYANELKGKGLGYWYGTNKKSNHDIVWRPFEEARGFVRKLEFQNTEEYNKWAKTDQKPQNIPTAPKRIYAEFSTMEDWLGNKERKQINYLNYFEAKKWAKSKKILTGAMWQKLSSQNKIPKNIPKAPAQFYDEWEGWPKFLETMIGRKFHCFFYRSLKGKTLVLLHKKGGFFNSPSQIDSPLTRLHWIGWLWPWTSS